jgi:hypothetical protein
MHRGMLGHTAEQSAFRVAANLDNDVSNDDDDDATEGAAYAGSTHSGMIKYMAAARDKAPFEFCAATFSFTSVPCLRSADVR